MQRCSSRFTWTVSAPLVYLQQPAWLCFFIDLCCSRKQITNQANHVIVNGMLRPRPRTKHQLCQPSAMLKLPNCRKPFALEQLSERKRAPAIVNWNAFHWAAHLQLTTSAYSRRAAMQVCRPRCVGAASVLLHAFGASSG